MPPVPGFLSPQVEEQIEAKQKQKEEADAVQRTLTRKKDTSDHMSRMYIVGINNQMKKRAQLIAEVGE